MTSEELLIRWVRERDEEAFRSIVALHAPMVFATSKRILGNEIEAEEVTQECFEKLAVTRRPGAYLGAWLHRVATNQCIDRLRSTQRRARRETSYAETRGIHVEAGWDDLYELVDEAIAGLPKAQRDVIVAYFLEGRSQAEIAESQGVTRQTVTRRVREGIEGVRKKLKRRGVQVSAAGLIGRLESQAGPKAIPVSLTASLGKLALTGAAISGGVVASGLMKAAAGVVLIMSLAVGTYVVKAMFGDSSSRMAGAAAPLEARTLASFLPALESGVLGQVAEPTDERPDADTNLLDRILAEQRAQYDALGKRSYHFMVSTTFLKPEAPVPTNRYEEVGDGFGRIWGEFRNGNATAGSVFAVNGEEFVGIMDRKGSSAIIIQLVQPADLPNAAFERLLIIQGRKTHSRRNPQAEQWFEMFRSVDYLRLGIVLIDQLTLAQAVEVAQTPESRHDVIAMKGKDGRDLFNVRRRSKRMNVAYAPQTEAIVDPAVGYRVVALISRFADGTVSRYSEYSFREYEPGVFVPTRCRDRLFVQDKRGPDLDTATIVANGIGDVPNELFIDRTITFENVELDYATTPERFSWKSFGLEGKQILLRSRDDSLGMYVVQNGELVTRKSVLGY